MAVNTNSKRCDTCNKFVSLGLFNTHRKLNTTTCFDCRNKNFVAARRQIKNKVSVEQQEFRLFLPTITQKNKRREIKDKRTVVFTNYVKSAQKRNKTFNLTIDQFYELKNGICSYCGKLGPNGIDRVDTSIGYEITNCVTYCKVCNASKFTMSVGEFIAHCYKIIQHRTSI